MTIKEIKELLANPEIKAVIESEILEAVKEKQAELDKSAAALEEAKKVQEKNAFLAKKTLLAKTSLYEKKLKEFYEKKFEFTKKKLATEVYDFMNESVKTLVASINEEASKNTKAAQLEEAFSNAARCLAPFMNITELASSNTEKVDELKDRINILVKENKTLKSKVLTDDIEALVVKETSEYPVDKKTLIFETVKKVAPKTLIEASAVIAEVKKSLTEKEEAAAKLVEEAALKIVPSKEHLKNVGKTVKQIETTSPANTTITESKTEVSTKAPWALYDISLLDD